MVQSYQIKREKTKNLIIFNATLTLYNTLSYIYIYNNYNYIYKHERNMNKIVMKLEPRECWVYFRFEGEA